MLNTAAMKQTLLKPSYHFIKNQVVYGTMLYHYGVARQRLLLKKINRSQCHTYTCFYRSPGQLSALTGPVMDYLLAGRMPGKFQINLFAASKGAEPYTIASMLIKNFPNLDFHISASDLHQEMIDRAREAVYTANEVLNEFVTDQFIADTFVKTGDRYQVRPEIRARVSFQQANLLDPKLSEKLEPADLIFAQNVFFHLDQPMAREAFRKVLMLLKPKSALFIDGMELDMREELTTEAGLLPLDFMTQEIHEAARKHVGDHWWNYYYGMEPYVGWRPNHLRRFSTVFFKGKSI